MVPERVRVPVPRFVSAPLLPEMAPEKVLERLSPPLVSTLPLSSTMLPAPAMEPTVSLVET